MITIELFRLFGSVFLKGDEANQGLDEIDKRAETTGGKLGKLAGGAAKAGAIVGGAMLAGGTAVLGLAKKTSATTDRIDKMSQKIGISREAFQEWDFILSQSGASVDGLQMGVKTLSNAALEASQGTESFKESFDELGLSVTDTDGELKSQETLLNETISALANMEDKTKRTAIASKLLGKSATELSPLFNAGTEAVDGMREKAHELGLVLSDEAVDAGVSMTDTMDQLNRTVGATMSQAIAPLLPVINNLLQEFIKIVPPLMSFIAPLAEKLIPVISTLAEKLIPSFLGILDALLPVVDPLLAVFLLLVDTVLVPFIDLLVPIIEELLPVFIELFNEFLPIIQPILQVMMELVKAVLPLFVEYWKMLAPILLPLIKIFAELAQDILPVIMDVVNVLVRNVLPVFMDVLKQILKIIGPLIEGIGKVVGGVSKVVGGTVSKVTGFVGGLFGKKKVPGAAEGGRVLTGGNVLVGEAGMPEVVNLRQGATITPLMGGRSGGLVLERGALEGALIMDDYGVDRLLDRIRDRIIKKDGKLG